MERIKRGFVPLVVMAIAISACADSNSALEPEGPLSSAALTLIDYDSKGMAEYAQKWVNIYGPLELAAGGTLDVGNDGKVVVSAEPFHVGADFSVYDHLKYIAISTQSFDMPDVGSLTFSADITAHVSGTEPGRIVRGCYGDPFSFPTVDSPCAQPYAAATLEGQQAGVVLNVINFETGQLFDWFVSGSEVFALIERLPSNVTNPALLPGDQGYVGLEKAYTQIIRTAPLRPGIKQRVAIRYTRGVGVSRVDYILNEKLFATVNNVGIPLDVQGTPFTGIYPSYGPGELLADNLDSFVIGHGLFSLLDAYPFQHPERPDLSVSIPMSERLFGQGATGTFTNFVVQYN
jgi:hypothetical protein